MNKDFLAKKCTSMSIDTTKASAQMPSQFDVCGATTKIALSNFGISPTAVQPPIRKIPFAMSFNMAAM